MQDVNLLWVPHASWSTPQRAKQFCEELARTCHVHVIDFYTGSRGFPDYISTEYARSMIPGRRRSTDGIEIHHIPRFAPSLFSRSLRRLNNNLAYRSIRSIIESESISNVIGSFVTPPPSCRNLIFDIFDPNPRLWLDSGRPNRGYAQEIQTIEEAYLKKADVVTAAGTILAYMYPYHKEIQVIPNGVRLSAYDHSDGQMARKKLDFEDSTLAVYSGYLESIEEAKLLLESVRIARKFTDLGLMLIGRGRGYEWFKRECEGMARIAFLGRVQDSELVRLISAADIALCPYGEFRSSWVPSAVTRKIENSSDPFYSSSMKLIEYSAAGLPTVCTNQISYNRIGFENVVFTGFKAEEFARGILQAAKMKKQRPSGIHEYDLPRLAGRFRNLLQ